jgi:hypothetical protein
MARAKVTQFTVAIPKELADRVKAEAEDRVLSPNFLIARAIEQFLAQLPPIKVLGTPFAKEHHDHSTDGE